MSLIKHVHFIMGLDIFHVHQISPGTIFCSFFFWFSHPCQSTGAMRLGCLLWSVPGVCVDLLAITDCWNLCGRSQRLHSHLCVVGCSSVYVPTSVVILCSLYLRLNFRRAIHINAIRNLREPFCISLLLHPNGMQTGRFGSADISHN